jgi:integrase/recombinase XerD
LRPTGSQGEEVNETETREQRQLSSLSSFRSIEDLIVGFDLHLERHRGCTEGTRKSYRREARALLARVFPDHQINWKNLTAGEIADFVGGRAKKLSLVSRQNPATAIRSFLRFCSGEGLIRAGLEGAVPRIWRSKHATIPRHVSAEQLENLLALCPSEGPGAVRNRAMLLLSARLGLRPSEVLRLRLQDLDWTTGSVLIRAGKTSRERVLPLPRDAGAALASYLREARPASTERAVFLSRGPAHPPIRGNGFMAKLVNCLLRRAGIGAPCSGAYVLRHTLATTMVRSGASFKEVADILGHGSLTTTGIYAKLDLRSLAQVALPWPGGAQ